MWSPDLYQRAIRFAAEAHRGQQVPGTELPYLLHLANVCMEVLTALAQPSAGGRDADLAMQCALLHDTLEDTAVTYEELRTRFGQAVADGVQALTKDERLPDKRRQMLDSLRRIRSQSPEIAMVKLADRITNLQPAPAHWSAAKRRAYREEARLILEQLGGVDPYLEARLAGKVAGYR